MVATSNNSSSQLALGLIGVVPSLISTVANAATSRKNAELQSTASIRNADLNAAVSIRNADLQSTASIRNADLNAAVSIRNADLQSTASIRNADLNAAVSIRNADLQRELQMKMEYLRIANQREQERERQDFQAKMSMLAHQQAKEIQEFVQSVNWAISQQNLDFQRWRFEQEKKLQKELAAANRETQIELAAYQRQTALQLPEVNKVIENWPLRLLPSQILNSSPNNQVVPLRIFISPPDIKFDKFANLAQGGSIPKIEGTLTEGLGRFLNQHYPLRSQTRPTEFLDGAWDSNRFYGGASIKALFSMLKSEPTLVLQSEIDGDYLNLRFAYWGLGNQYSDNYCYETIFSRFPYGNILSESAKARALKWKETRDKLLAMGEHPEKIKRLGGDNNINLEIWQDEEKYKELGIDIDGISLHYKVNYDDFQSFCQFLITTHCLISGWIADIHHLFYNNEFPLLPELLPTLIQDNIDPQLLRTVVLGYQQICQTKTSHLPHWIPEISLQLAQSLTHLSEKSWAKGQLHYSISTWLSQRQVQQVESVKPLEVMKSLVRVADKEYLGRLQECFTVLDDGEAVNKIEEIFSVLDDRSYYEQGIKFATQGEYQTAIEHFDWVIEINPKHTTAYYNRGLAHGNLGNDQLAIQDYSQVILLDPNHVEAYNHRGSLYYKNEAFDKALADYERVLQLTPNSSQAVMNRDIAQHKFNLTLKPIDYREQLPKGAVIEMVAIPAGSFIMGSPDGEGEDRERPQHRVTISDFYMGKYPVTNAQWQEVMGTKPSSNYDAKFTGSSQPVVGVNWNDAQEFCQKLSQLSGKKYRLPSEAEWEYACRAGTTTPFSFGENINPKVVNYDGNYPYGNAAKGEYRAKTTEVGSFPANKFGLFDMHGNVWEWCADHWHDNYNGAPNDGSIWLSSNESYHLLRGGSWYNNAGNCRSAYRFRYAADDRFNRFGFRVVCS